MEAAWSRPHRRRWLVRVQDDPPGIVSADPIPQHIHVALQTADGNYHAGEWRFSDDPMVEEAERADSARAGLFGWVRPVDVGEAGHTIDVKVRVNPDRAFS